MARTDISVEIESPTVADVETLTDLWVDLAAGQRDYGSHLYATTNREIARDSVAHHVATEGLLVARVDEPAETIAGFVMFAPEGGHYDQDVSRGVIENLYVAPDYRNEGIGAALLAAAESRLVAAGLDAVTLDAMATNEAARRFYRRHGYEPHRVELEKRVENDNKTRQDD